MAVDPHLLHADHLPTPFTADEIRAACPAGRSLRLRVERAGEPTIIRVSQYVANDLEGTVQESWAEAPDGRRLEPPERERSTWLELQAHASFPADTTERDDETIEIPAGRFACLRYTRKDPDGVWRFWFALDLPGQPVRYEHEVDGAVVSSVTLLENLTGSAVS
jgi:hypothetical protein